VVINDEFNGSGGSPVQLASADLNSEGTAVVTVPLATGSNSLTAAFVANTADLSSTSTPAVVASVAAQCDYTVGVSNLAPASTPADALANTLTPGQTGTATVSVYPSAAFVSSLSAPSFIALSCSGLPDYATCSFTSPSVEIVPGDYAAVTSSMQIQTVAASTTSISPAPHPGKGSSPIAWAFLLPGALGLGGLAWGTRRRRWLSRLSLVVLTCLMTLLGATACNPRYNYEHHGPVPNPATPAGTYTVTVTAQSSNGVTADISSTTIVLTVN
jgi:hypothetical protein